jgi:RNA polymerase sigma-70 factor (ECF subfamily)
MVRLNGEPGLLRYLHGELESALAFETDGERIVALYAVRNPDKLQAIASAMPMAQTAVTNGGAAAS